MAHSSMEGKDTKFETEYVIQLRGISKTISKDRKTHAEDFFEGMMTSLVAAYNAQHRQTGAKIIKITPGKKPYQYWED